MHAYFEALHARSLVGDAARAGAGTSVGTTLGRGVSVVGWGSVGDGVGAGTDGPNPLVAQLYRNLEQPTERVDESECAAGGTASR